MGCFHAVWHSSALQEQLGFAPLISKFTMWIRPEQLALALQLRLKKIRKNYRNTPSVLAQFHLYLLDFKKYQTSLLVIDMFQCGLVIYLR